MKTAKEASKIRSSLYYLRSSLLEAGFMRYILRYIDEDETVLLKGDVVVNVHMDSVEATLRDVMRAIIKEEEKC
jgi:hypothetical protein